MKTLLSFVVLFFSTVLSSVAFATLNNPLQRACLRAHGVFIVAEIHADQIGLCQVNQSYVSATTLMHFFDEGLLEQAGETFLKGPQDCTGTLIQAVSLEGVRLNLCHFKDGSYLDLTTLQSGSNDPRNQALKTVLSSNFSSGK